MDEPAGRHARLLVEEPDLVADARPPQVPDAQAGLDLLRELDGGLERAVRLGAEPDHLPAMDVETALADEPRVDDGVEERVVLDVVDMPVDVVVLPARPDR